MRLALALDRGLRVKVGQRLALVQELGLARVLAGAGLGADRWEAVGAAGLWIQRDLSCQISGLGHSTAAEQQQSRAE
jgi:hypothetical protein